MKKLNLGKGSRLGTIAVIVGVFGLILVLMTAFAQAPANDHINSATVVSPPITTTVRHLLTSGAVVNTGWGEELTQGYFLAAADTTTAYVSYSGVAFDPTSQVCSPDPLLGTYCRYTRATFDLLSADINPSDLSVNGNTARLNTDLATASNVLFSRCVYDDTDDSTVCTDKLPTGLISLQWQKTMTNSFHSVGVIETKTGPQTVRVSGSRSEFSADTTGSILGTVVVHQPGNFGTYKSVVIDILRTT
jgi:hypothetical protein